MRTSTKPIELTPEEHLRFVSDMMYRCYSNMEGANLENFNRWEKLYLAYSTISCDLLKEMINHEKSKAIKG